MFYFNNGGTWKIEDLQKYSNKHITLNTNLFSLFQCQTL